HSLVTSGAEDHLAVGLPRRHVSLLGCGSEGAAVRTEGETDEAALDAALEPRFLFQLVEVPEADAGAVRDGEPPPVRTDRTAVHQEIGFPYADSVAFPSGA